MKLNLVLVLFFIFIILVSAQNNDNSSSSSSAEPTKSSSSESSSGSSTGSSSKGSSSSSEKPTATQSVSDEASSAAGEFHFWIIKYSNFNQNCYHIARPAPVPGEDGKNYGPDDEYIARSSATSFNDSYKSIQAITLTTLIAVFAGFLSMA